MEGVLSVFCQVFDGLVYCEAIRDEEPPFKTGEHATVPVVRGGTGGLENHQKSHAKQNNDAKKQI